MKTHWLALRLFLGWFWVGCSCVAARGDGGTVRLRERKGPYEITVFTSPTPFRAGPVDISVLVQDAASGEPLPTARVTVTLTARRRQYGLHQAATSSAATNKLLRSALFELPWAGWWEVEVTVAAGVEEGGGEETVRFAVEAAEPLPHWVALWPWLAWPALAVAVFGVHRRLVRRSIDSPSRA